jgi:hypothetical protein
LMPCLDAVPWCRALMPCLDVVPALMSCLDAMLSEKALIASIVASHRRKRSWQSLNQSLLSIDHCIRSLHPVIASGHCTRSLHSYHCTQSSLSVIALSLSKLNPT